MKISFKIKRFFVRTFYFFFNPVRLSYLKIFKINTFGAKCLIKYGNKFLMVRNYYGQRKWTFPGGGVKKNEDPQLGACRETKEEVGILIEDPVLLGQYVNLKEERTDKVFCYYQEVSAPDFKLCPYEIAEAGWFALEEFPDYQAHSVAKVMVMYKDYWENLQRN
ncbi:MAG: hypothetical protein COV08_01755 [Candidatus Vogelbacteria bacterium CG10_big_fil_rev_8_21_14_0_10_49_38]|uniref:Nudix hydrolase domain-containing protein n=1 Tax=Candidatus Vogelbacteria bacterium CG10_big_fil_rev_8_21_14_0_10_49_38 TaxID=1975043 RepID=A0A2H0RI10_9BACT|nr:MAG: hypothetical protein BK006_01770 [bacterium CG10_49_38]PIR46123.1 MAG: hypothetical protein COV08_01755 [Candidatus Vogelbacteria bacterium CG10_big_fil_rev_8_21_14_0_10_49_38]